jgi:hypothetical protein
MKRWFFLLALSFCHLVFAAPLQERKIDRAALNELFTATGIPIDAEIVSETQKRWLRKPGLERWEVAELPSHEKELILRLAKQHGLFDAWRPLLTLYDKAFILGATTSRMELRLDFLKQLWNEGVRFKEVVWLTGDRPLDKRVDGLMDRCSTESEAARLIWQEAHLPDKMRALPVVFVAVPMKKEGKTLKRPNTQDTIDAWLESNPRPCRALFVSNQPLSGYSYAVVKTTLPDNFLFDLVGPPAPLTSENAAILLDSLARWIYQENLLIR